MAEVIAYAPNRVADLPAERSQLKRAVVYHMLGRLSASPTYVVSDEDMLEFICALQSEHLTPRSCSTNSSTTTCCSSAAISPTGWRDCSCAWPSASGSPIPATSRGVRGRHTMQDERLVAFLAAGERNARASMAALRHSSPSCMRAG